MRELSAGLGIVQVLFFVLLLAVAATVAAWAAIAYLAIWTLIFLIRALVAWENRDKTGAIREPILTWSDFNLVAVTASAAVLGTVFMTENSSLLTVLVSLLVIAAALKARPRVRSKNFTEVALITALGLSAFVAVVGGFALWNDAPDSVTAEEAPAYGDAVQIEDVWAKVECLDGTATDSVSSFGAFTYDSSVITRVGSCTISEPDEGEEAGVVYFFQADDTEDLDRWLISGDLHVDPDMEHRVRLVRDGAVAIATVDAGSSINLSNDGYERIRLK